MVHFQEQCVPPAVETDHIVTTPAVASVKTNKHNTLSGFKIKILISFNELTTD